MTCRVKSALSLGAAADGFVVAADTEREKIWERDKAGVIKRDKQGRKLFRRGKKVVGWGNYVIIQHADGYRTRLLPICGKCCG